MANHCTLAVTVLLLAPLCTSLLTNENEKGLHVALPPIKPVRARVVDIRPRFIYADTCSGSTFVFKFVQTLLQLHGIRTFINNNVVTATKEVLKNKKVNGKDATSKQNVLELMYEAATARNETLIIKVRPEDLISSPSEKGDVPRWLRSFGSLPVSMFRGNALDHVVCAVKDCFEAPGHPVSLNGSRLDLCFNRRKMSTAVQARLYSGENLTNALQSLGRSSWRQVNALRTAGFDEFASVSYEDLASFQYKSHDAKYRSLVAWCAVLQSLGVHPDVDAVRRTLQQHAGTYHEPYPLDHTIYNIHEVVVSLRHHPDLARYLCYPGYQRHNSGPCADAGAGCTPLNAWDFGDDGITGYGGLATTTCTLKHRVDSNVAKAASKSKAKPSSKSKSTSNHATKPTHSHSD